jgi:hypothetical protein
MSFKRPSSHPKRKGVQLRESSHKSELTANQRGQLKAMRQREYLKRRAERNKE